MKKLLLSLAMAALAGMTLTGCTVCCKKASQPADGMAAEAVKELKVLTIGNSFADSVFRELPKIAAADKSCKLTLVRANIGGCSFKRHWNEHLKSEKDPKHLPYQKKYTLRQLLTQQRWDIVTIQQVSTESWRPETYQPYADNLIKLIRELAPQAEIVIQQTWAYNATSPRFSKWKITQQEMYDKLTAGYTGLAQKNNFRIIPSGYAVQLYRRTMGDKLVSMDPADLSKLVKPAKPATNDLCGAFGWTKDKQTGADVPHADLSHLNGRGAYYQSLVWYTFLFGKDPEKNTYAPKNVKPEEAALFKKLAKQAVAEFPQVKK